MSTINTLSEFLLQASTEYRVYDMGRGIRKISSQSFLDIETGNQPHPYPRQGHAWLGIIFWNKSLSRDHYIWFLKLPVDETATLISGPRDHFLHLVVDALSNTTLDGPNALSTIENPYNFSPSQQVLADFNALTKVELKLPPSEYYHQVRQYLLAPSVVNWQQLAHQGLADFCARLPENDNAALLENAFSTLPSPIQNVCLSSLEHYELSQQLIASLIASAEKKWPDINAIALTIRAFAHSQQHQTVQAYIMSSLKKDEARDINLLSVIVARHWQLLSSEPALVKLFEQSVLVGVDICTGLYKDLVGIPSMREYLLKMLRSTQDNSLLNQCFEGLRRELLA